MSNLMKYLQTFHNYYYLLTLLVKKNIKKKYKGSFLGILWSLLSPLLNMLIVAIIFSALFKNNIKNFPVYILTGRLLFDFFAESTSTSINSIIFHADLIKKVYIPKYIITLSNILSNFIFFLISFIDLAIIMVVTKSTVSFSLMFVPIYLILLFFFCCGISLTLSALTVYFRDIEHLYGVLIAALLYASAIFYPADIIPGKFQLILKLNPLYYYISGFRNVVYSGNNANPHNLLECLILAVLSMIIGIIIFKKNQDKFILYV